MCVCFEYHASVIIEEKLTLLCHLLATSCHCPQLQTDTNGIQPSYGLKTKECELEASEAEKIMLSKFDEDDLYQHMMKIMFGCGLFAAFRGRTEHTMFYISQIKIGQYPANFENKELAGLKYAAIDHMVNEKTNKITINNSYSRGTSHIMRFPIVEGDPNNFGGALARLMEKFAPGQERVYCKKATPEKRAEWIAKGYPKAEFFHNLQLGEKSIGKLFKKGAEILGLTKCDKFRPHSLRGACISTLVNDKSVSLAETMRVARHNSASASKVYQRVDGISEGNRLAALGQMPAPDTKQNATACKEKGVSGHDDGNKSDSSESTIMLGMGRKRSASLFGDDSSSAEEASAPRKKHSKTESKTQNEGMTQACISELKGDIISFNKNN